MALALATAALAAAVVAALLWPEERLSAAGRARAMLFALLAGCVGLALVGRQADRAASISTVRAFQAYTEGLIDARSLEANRWASRWAAR